MIQWMESSLCEESMKNAIDDVRNGMSIRAVAEKNQVAKTTLCNRLNSNGEIPVRGRPALFFLSTKNNCL